jgi:carbon storage regulator CsrA
MLVISRKPHEKIVIPAIGACIHVAAVQPGVVRVAISAPPEVVILRGEVADRIKEWETPLPHEPAALPAVASLPAKPRRSRRRLRDRLRVASMSVGLARLHLHTSMNPRAAAILHQAHQQMEALCRHLDRKQTTARSSSKAVPSSRPKANERVLPHGYSRRLLQAVDA